MTSIAVLIPRLRYRTGRVVAFRCTACHLWHKPRRFDLRTTTCHSCSYGAARKRITARANRRS